ncbi:MAG: polysaccharide pyruvyl transferase family protein [Lachnospiraceae bacterium]|nr:polysaccharide pyruvyl transferase family protein [Lachnospiraceae bacterium]
MKKYVIYGNENFPVMQTRKPTGNNFQNLKKDFLTHNTGTLMFFDAINNYLTQSDIKYEYTNGRTPDEINGLYDVCIDMEANLFSVHNYELMVKQTEEFKAYNMPIYVVGVGIQAGIDESMKELAKKIHYPVYQFVNAIYKSGGELGVRGYYTKELLDIIYPQNTAVVIGCPSLYVNGPEFEISNYKVDRKDFSYLVNGRLFDMERPFLRINAKKYKHMYIDQHEFGDLIYAIDKIDKSELTKEKLIDRYTETALVEFAKGNVKHFFDLPLWKKECSKYSFSFGRRIHGNIAAIISGTPALLNYSDRRTEEIAKYFNIPTTCFRYDREDDIYDLYLETDYSSFNRTYKENYKKFKEFLQICGIEDFNNHKYRELLEKNGPWNERSYDYVLKFVAEVMDCKITA